MRHLVVAFAALFVLTFAVLEACDSPPPLALVQPLVGETIPDGVPMSRTQFKSESPWRPPHQYQQPNAAVVIMGDMETVQKLCEGSAEPRADQTYLGCMGFKNGTPIIAVPDPCLMPETDFYADILCHELGHENGWKHDA